MKPLQDSGVSSILTPWINEGIGVLLAHKYVKLVTIHGAIGACAKILWIVMSVGVKNSKLHPLILFFMVAVNVINTTT